MDTSHLEHGARVDGFLILDTLGHGGMSDVYRAHDEANAREVTLKFPHDEIMGDPATYERFSREIKIGQLLEHPNIQRLYSVGKQGRLPYLVLEFVPGASLRSALKDKDERFGSLDEALSLGIQIGRALAYAHEKGVFHRDMKPENVIVTPDGIAKVMDFGIAFVQGARRVTWGSLSGQVGTPDYMAPEQIKGQRGDARTDVYALGTMIYEMIAGRLPYEGDNALAVMSQHVSAPAPLLSTFCSVPPEIDEIVLKSLRRDASKRWNTMAEFVSALEAPQSVDAQRLREEREREEGSVSAPKSGDKKEGGEGFLGLGISAVQLALVVIGVLVVFLLIGIFAQLAHSGR